MIKPLLIIGAGNVGGFISYNINEFTAQYNILGFLDDDPQKIGKKLYGQQVLGSIADLPSFLEENLAVVIGIANPIIKKKISINLSSYNLDFPSFISSNVWLSQKVTLGKGVIIYPGTAINYETVIEDFAIINMNCAIGHNCYISKYATLAPGVSLAGFTKIGEASDIGIGVSTKQQIIIGAGATIGGQTMVVKDVAPYSKVKGVPGRVY